MGFCKDAQKTGCAEGGGTGGKGASEYRIRFSFSDGGPSAAELLARVIELAEDALRRDPIRRRDDGAAGGGTGHD